MILLVVTLMYWLLPNIMFYIGKQVHLLKKKCYYPANLPHFTQFILAAPTAHLMLQIEAMTLLPTIGSIFPHLCEYINTLVELQALSHSLTYTNMHVHPQRDTKHLLLFATKQNWQ